MFRLPASGSLCFAFSSFFSFALHSSALRCFLLSQDVIATMASADFSPALAGEISLGQPWFFPLVPSCSTSCAFDNLWPLPPAAGSARACGLTACLCSYGREFAFSPFNLRLTASVWRQLRLALSPPLNSFHFNRTSACQAHRCLPICPSASPIGFRSPATAGDGAPMGARSLAARCRHPRRHHARFPSRKKNDAALFPSRFFAAVRNGRRKASMTALPSRRVPLAPSPLSRPGGLGGRTLGRFAPPL